MSPYHLEFHVEEESMEKFLYVCLPKIVPHCTYEIRNYGGKQALLRKLEARLRGAAKYIQPHHRIIVIVDRDRSNCKELKSKLEAICQRVGLRSRQVAGSSDWQAVTRIAIAELEAWYFGDWAAVCKAYHRVEEGVPRKRGFRDPDMVNKPCIEFERLLQKRGYMKGRLVKGQAATDVGRHFDPQVNTSRSFQVLRDALIEATT